MFLGTPVRTEFEMTCISKKSQLTMKALERNSNGNAESAHDCTDANIDQKKKCQRKIEKESSFNTNKLLHTWYRLIHTKQCNT